MARPFKYNWEKIKEAYEKGFTPHEISKKFNITTKALGDKARASKWQIKSNINNELVELVANSEKIISNAINDEVKEMIEDRINTLIEDNLLIGTNRKILKLCQGVIINNRKDINISNVRNVTGAIKDIESIANPYPETIIQNNNQNQQQNNITVEWE